MFEQAVKSLRFNKMFMFMNYGFMNYGSMLYVFGSSWPNKKWWKIKQFTFFACDN